MPEPEVQRSGPGSARAKRDAVKSRFLRATFLLGFVLASVAGTAHSNPPEKHPFGIDDYLALHRALALSANLNVRRPPLRLCVIYCLVSS
jgi:hypothetical protein